MMVLDEQNRVSIPVNLQSMTELLLLWKKPSINGGKYENDVNESNIEEL